jgi:hypothetical protein
LGDPAKRGARGAQRGVPVEVNGAPKNAQRFLGM